MILPTKHLHPDRTLLAQGAILLGRLEQPQTITALWNVARESASVPSFDQFCLGLSFLYAVGAVELRQGLVQRTE